MRRAPSDDDPTVQVRTQPRKTMEKSKQLKDPLSGSVKYLCDGGGGVVGS
jgi:hypothetical protein